VVATSLDLEGPDLYWLRGAWCNGLWSGVLTTRVGRMRDWRAMTSRIDL